jgi:hypothetical protein
MALSKRGKEHMFWIFAHFFGDLDTILPGGLGCGSICRERIGGKYAPLPWRFRFARTARGFGDN